MPDIIIHLIGNQEKNNENPIIDSIKESFDILLENVNIEISNIDESLLEKCAGHILEEYIKLNLSNITSPEIKRHFTFKDNKYYDFKYDLNKIKIITFNKSNEYSDNYLSRKLIYEAGNNNLMFLFIVYTINENKIKISNIKIAKGISICTTNAIYEENDKIYSKLVEENQDQEIEEKIPIKMVFTSNLSGEVQIINI